MSRDLPGQRLAGRPAVLVRAHREARPGGKRALAGLVDLEIHLEAAFPLAPHLGVALRELLLAELDVGRFDRDLDRKFLVDVKTRRRRKHDLEPVFGPGLDGLRRLDGDLILLGGRRRCCGLRGRARARGEREEQEKWLHLFQFSRSDKVRGWPGPSSSVATTCSIALRLAAWPRSFAPEPSMPAAKRTSWP